MLTDRRQSLKQLGLLLAGAGLLPMQAFSSAAPAMVGVAGGSEDDRIRLSSNENPYGPSAEACLAMARAAGSGNRYQWQMARELMTAIAAHHGLGAGNVLTGPGSTHVIDAVIQYAAHEKGNFVAANPTFSRWAGAAGACGLSSIAVPLTRSKRHDLNAMLNAINKDTRMVYICNPNNPTGTICRHEALLDFIKHISRKVVVLVDEAYLDYTHEPSLCHYAAAYENVVVVRTFSKIYGLAGARIGYALGHTKTIEKLGAIQSGANAGISAMSMAGALAALRDRDFIHETYRQNREARAFTIDGLERLGIRCISSHTNFIYFSLAGYKDDFFGRLRAHNIEGTGIFEEDGKWSRITVGRMREMEYFIEAVR